MKKLFLSMSLMLAALTLTNCTKDAAEDKAIVDNGKGFSFTANIDTRATLEGVKTVWEAGDQIGFGGSIDNKQESNGNIQLLAFDYVSGSTFNNAEASYADAQTFYAIYPYTASSSGSYIYPADHASRANQTTVYYIVGSQGTATQDGASAAHIPAVSPMYYVSADAVSPADLAVQLHHTTSLMKFTVTNGEDAALTVKSLRFSVPSTIKICGTFYINIATGELISSGTNYTYSAQTVSVENAPALAKGESFDVYMAVAPFELAANDMITVVVTASDDTTCTIEKKMAAATAFEAGKLNTATVNFVKDAVAETPMTVSELAQALEAGTTTFAGKRVQGFVSAVAAGDTDNFSKGTVILTDNSGNEYSAVKFYNSAATGLAQFSGLAIGDELEIDLSNAGVGDYNGKQITGVTVDDIINGEAISVDNQIIAKEISIADYKANFAAYNNVYLKFVDVTPTVAGVFTGTIAFTDGTNEVNAYGKKSSYGDWDAGKIEIGKITGTLYGIGQVYSNAPQVCPVTVADIEAFEAPFTIDKESVSFTADGGSETVNIAFTKDGYTLGTVENTATWLTVTPASDGTILFTAAANTDTVARDTEVTVAVMKDGAAFATITIAVSQKAPGDAMEYTATSDATLFGGQYTETELEPGNADITYIVDKGSSTSNNTYYSPARFYKGTSLTINANNGASMTKFVFNANTAAYATALETVLSSISGLTVSKDSKVVTAICADGKSSITISFSNEQVRIDKIVVTYEK